MSARLSSEEMQAVQRLMEPEIKHWEKNHNVNADSLECAALG